MKRFFVIAVSLVFAAFLTMNVAAQVPTGGDKVGLVAWGAFQEPTKGIKKYIAAINALELEFKPVNDDLTALATKYQALGRELQGYKDLIDQNKPVPISQLEISKRADAFGQMDRDIKKKQEDAKAAYQSRWNVVVSPIEDDIVKVMTEFAEAKGYAVILDGAKLQESGILLGFSRKSNVTDEFILYYNSRPPTTTPLTTPK